MAPGPQRDRPPAFSAALLERVRGLARGAQPADPWAWAIRQGVAPLVAGGADAAPRDDAEAWGPRERLERHAGLAALLWEVSLRHLRLSTAALADAGVPCLVVKGAAHALRHYPEPAWRAMVDLDLLVRPTRWRDAARVLTSLGFALADETEHAGVFAGPGGRIVELHGFLTSCPGLFPVSFDELHGRAVPLGPAVDAAGLADEDALLHAGLHAGFQHGFRLRVGQYLDFERLLARPLDWPRLIERAGEARAIRPLAAGLAVADALLDVRPPQAAAEALRPHVPPAVTAWIDGLRRTPWRLLDGLPLPRARWALVAGAAARRRLVVGTLLPLRPDGRRYRSLPGLVRRTARLARACLRPRPRPG